MARYCMELSNDLLSQFAKITNDNKKEEKEVTVYGTTVTDNGKQYVRLDGSDRLTPISTTTDMKPDERVTVMIKNHTATVTGNLSSPAARTDDVKEQGSKISEFEIVMAYKVTTEDLEAVNATIESLKAKVGNFTEMNAVLAQIETLQAKFAELDHVSAYSVIVGHKVQSQAVVANAWHHRSDAFSSIGTALGIAGAIFLGKDWRVLDPIAAVIVSIFIVKVSIQLLIPCLNDLLERSLPEETEKEIITIINEDPQIKDPHNWRSRGRRMKSSTTRATSTQRV